MEYPGAKNYEIVYSNESIYLNSTDKIYKLENTFILIDYPNGSANPPIIKYFNSKFKLTDSIKMRTIFDNAIISNFTIEGIGFNNSIINFDIKKNLLPKQSLNGNKKNYCQRVLQLIGAIDLMDLSSRR